MLLQAAVEGLAYSGLYAMLGMGFHLVFGVLRRIDLAYGTVVMASVYVAAMASGSLGIPWLVLPIALAIAVALALVVSLLAFHLVRGDLRFSMAATLGLWMAIEELVFQGPGLGRGQSVPNPLADAVIAAGPLSLRLDHLLALALALATAAALKALLVRTRWGLAVRLTASDPQAASLMGVSPRATAFSATALAAVTGCLAGLAFAAGQQAMDVHFGMWSTVKGLVILVLGGVASLRGIVIASLLLGTTERVATELAGPGWRDLIGYGLMAALLAAFPKGFETAARARTT